MRIIAIETSGRHGSLAAFETNSSEPTLLAEKVLTDVDGRTAQALAPTLKSLLDKIGWAPTTIELVAVAVGPGSFTGLRIGVTTAKTLAYAVGAEIIGVDTHAVMAEAAPSSSAPLWTILDAQRQELFVAKFSGAQGARSGATSAVEPAIATQSDWLAMLKTGDHVAGPPLSKLVAQLPPGVTPTPQETWEPTAAAVGRVAWRAYQAGQRDDLWQLVPLYYRLSAAEEKANQRDPI